MPDLADFLEFFIAVAVIIVISIFITLAWMSTYVRDQPVVATAVVVFQQEHSPNSSTNNSGSIEEQATSQILECESPPPDSSTLNEPEGDGNPSKAEENMSLQDSIDTGMQSSNDSDISKCEPSVDNVNDSKDLKQTEEQCSDEKDPVNIQLEEKNCESVLKHRRQCNLLEKDVANEDVNSLKLEAEAEVLVEELSPHSIRIKLKFLDDTQRLVRGQLTDEVGSFKRANFDSELTSNRVVRLIFNGQLLNRDNTTLGQYGLFDNCVVHCHISQPQPVNANQMNENSINQENEGLDLSEMLSPLLLLIVAFLWYLRYEYSHIFNTSATIILVCLTALLLISQYAIVISYNISLRFEGGNGNGGDSSPRRGAEAESLTPQTNEPSLQRLTMDNADERLSLSNRVTSISSPNSNSSIDSTESSRTSDIGSSSDNVPVSSSLTASSHSFSNHVPDTNTIVLSS